MSLAAKYVDSFLAGMDKSGTALYNKTVGNIRNLNTAPNGTLVRSQNNLDQIETITSEYTDYFTNSSYTNRLKALLGSINPIAVEISQRFTKRYGDIPEEVIQQAVIMAEQYYEALEITLTSDMVAEGIINPVINDLYHAVGKGDSLESLEDSYPDTKNIFHAYFVTKVTVLLEQFERELIEFYGEAFNVILWEYEGPDDERTRDFCGDRVGGKYTTAEIQEWAKEDWAGKIPGTNMETIFTNAGGYNCRHTFVPSNAMTIECNSPCVVKLENSNEPTPAPIRPFRVQTQLTNNKDENLQLLYDTHVISLDTTVLKEYTGSNFQPLSEYKNGLYNDNPDRMAMYKAYDEELARSLRVLPQLDAKIEKLYRVENIDPERMKMYLDNEYTMNTNYWSTASRKESSYFAQGNFGAVDPGDKLRIIITPAKRSTAKDISGISSLGSEREVLYESGVVYRRVSYDEMENILYLEEVEVDTYAEPTATYKDKQKQADYEELFKRLEAATQTKALTGDEIHRANTAFQDNWTPYSEAETVFQNVYKDIAYNGGRDFSNKKELAFEAFGTMLVQYLIIKDPDSRFAYQDDFDEDYDAIRESVKGTMEPDQIAEKILKENSYHADAAYEIYVLEQPDVTKKEFYRYYTDLNPDVLRMSPKKVADKLLEEWKN